jgi:hypothetical protein
LIFNSPDTIMDVRQANIGEEKAMKTGVLGTGGVGRRARVIGPHRGDVHGL